MNNLSQTSTQIQTVSSFEELVSTPFHGSINAMCWSRNLVGDFSEIVNKLEVNENMVVLHEEKLCKLQLSEQGQLARNILLNDLKLLKDFGAAPTLNIIKYYERDDEYPYFPTDVYSYHVDRSPIPTDTFLCTYYGEASEILPNSQSVQKILNPEIRHELQKLYGGSEEGFETYLIENFFDLHYEAKPNAKPINLGIGNLWKLAIDYPESKVLPCIHRAPKEKTGEYRLLLIC